MRDRISKAKAFVAVRNYNAAIYELENIRRESSDPSVNAVTNVLLMNAYLEQGDYKRAQDFLNEFFKSYKSNSARGNLYYAAVAAQVIKGARNQVERYRALGLSVSDRNLPLEAVNDIERMRETLELVITQAKDLGTDKTKASAAMALLEEATNSRSMIARDDYDARRWRDALGDSREEIASSQSVIINAVDGTTVATPTPVPQETVAMNTSTTQNFPAAASSAPLQQTVFKPVPADSSSKPKPSETLLASNDKPVIQQPVQQVQQQQQPATDPQRSRVIDNKPTMQVPIQPSDNNSNASLAAGPVDVGSLIAYATKQQAPIYPPAARSMRATGVVKVEVTVNETGEVAEVQKTSGPTLLQAAAKDAIKKWKFKPFVRDGQPVKATGFVNFNFSL
jgi:protein TonB